MNDRLTAQNQQERVRREAAAQGQMKSDRLAVPADITSRINPQSNPCR